VSASSNHREDSNSILHPHVDSASHKLRLHGSWTSEDTARKETLVAGCVDDRKEDGGQGLRLGSDRAEVHPASNQKIQYPKKLGKLSLSQKEGTN
jgi:hypothetical protein